MRFEKTYNSDKEKQVRIYLSNGDFLSFLMCPYCNFFAKSKSGRILTECYYDNSEYEPPADGDYWDLNIENAQSLLNILMRLKRVESEEVDVEYLFNEINEYLGLGFTFPKSVASVKKIKMKRIS